MPLVKCTRWCEIECKISICVIITVDILFYSFNLYLTLCVTPEPVLDYNGNLGKGGLHLRTALTDPSMIK